MKVEKVSARRGVEVMVGDELQMAQFEFGISEVDEDWIEAQARVSGMADKAVDDFLESIRLDETPQSKEQEVRRTTNREASVTMVRLRFSSTNSKPRADRIARASSEEFSFEPSTMNGGWICEDKNGRRFKVDADVKKGTGRCDCEDFLFRGIKEMMPCKHIYALLISADQVWETNSKKTDELN